MRLTGVKPGDLIEVNDGTIYLARVLDGPARQRIRVQPLTFKSFPREARARDVIAHYRRAKVRS